MHLGVDYEQIGLLDEAARLATAVAQAKPGDREALELLTRIHERRHSINDLKADYARRLRLQPDSPELWSRLSQVQAAAGNLFAARDSLLRLLALRRAVRCRDCGQRTFFPVSASAECNQAAFSEPG